MDSWRCGRLFTWMETTAGDTRSTMSAKLGTPERGLRGNLLGQVLGVGGRVACPSRKLAPTAPARKVPTASAAVRLRDLTMVSAITSPVGIARPDSG
ncbi:MAG: hypothetical protein AcusKO_25760 [Acuticoccus sp.]